MFRLHVQEVCFSIAISYRNSYFSSKMWTGDLVTYVKCYLKPKYLWQ